MFNLFSEKKQSIFFSFTSAPFSERPHFKPAHCSWWIPQSPGLISMTPGDLQDTDKGFVISFSRQFPPSSLSSLLTGRYVFCLPIFFPPKKWLCASEVFAVWRAGKPLWEWIDSNIFKMWAFIRSSRWRKQSGAPRTKGREYFTQVWSTHQLDSAGTSSWNQWKKDHLCAEFGRSQHSLTESPQCFKDCIHSGVGRKSFHSSFP